MVFILQDQYGKFNKVPEWQRLAGKAAKEVEKFAKEKVDLVLMHWRDRMGIAQKEVKILKALCYSNFAERREEHRPLLEMIGKLPVIEVWRYEKLHSSASVY